MPLNSHEFFIYNISLSILPKHYFEVKPKLTLRCNFFQGESLRNVNYPVHRSFQVTALAWHPDKIILVTGWENGELKIWNGSDKEFSNVVGPHKAPITFLGFSEKGSRMVSCDSVCIWFCHFQYIKLGTDCRRIQVRIQALLMGLKIHL